MIEAAPVHWFDDIDSTSSEARRRAGAGQLNPIWIAARRQTSGRGRLGRPWISTFGNLYTTVLFGFDRGPAEALKLPFATALAVARTCSLFAPEASVRLKWPNDVRIDGAKLSGILVESGTYRQRGWVAIGIGINLAEAPSHVDQDATCLSAHMTAPCPAPEFVLELLQRELAAKIDLAAQDFPELLQRWIKHAEGLGTEISAGPEGHRVRGVFTGLAQDGGLILTLPDGAQRIIRAGEIEIVKQVS